MTRPTRRHHAPPGAHIFDDGKKLPGASVKSLFVSVIAKDLILTKDSNRIGA